MNGAGARGPGPSRSAPPRRRRRLAAPRAGRVVGSARTREARRGPRRAGRRGAAAARGATRRGRRGSGGSAPAPRGGGEGAPGPGGEPVAQVGGEVAGLAIVARDDERRPAARERVVDPVEQ